VVVIEVGGGAGRRYCSVYLIVKAVILGDRALLPFNSFNKEGSIAGDLGRPRSLLR
jgi:hypothetical protein